jgi:hypothetical protein
MSKKTRLNLKNKSPYFKAALIVIGLGVVYGVLRTQEGRYKVLIEANRWYINFLRNRLLFTFGQYPLRSKYVHLAVLVQIGLIKLLAGDKKTLPDQNLCLKSILDFQAEMNQCIYRSPWILENKVLLGKLSWLMTILYLSVNIVIFRLGILNPYLAKASLKTLMIYHTSKFVSVFQVLIQHAAKSISKSELLEEVASWDLLLNILSCNTLRASVETFIFSRPLFVKVLFLLFVVGIIDKSFKWMPNPVRMFLDPNLLGRSDFANALDQDLGFSILNQKVEQLKAEPNKQELWEEVSEQLLEFQRSIQILRKNTRNSASLNRILDNTHQRLTEINKSVLLVNFDRVYRSIVDEDFISHFRPS